MHSGGTIGSALPVVVGAEGLMPIPDASVREKEISFLRSQFAAAAEKHGRNPALAAAMVDPDAEARLIKVDGEARVVGAGEYDALRQEGREFSLLDTLAVKGKLVNLTARRAVELRMADALADDAPALMERAGLNATAVVGPLEKSRSESFVAWIERLTPILLMAGLVLGFLELKSPGFGVPGVLAIAAFVVLLVGKYFAGLAEVPHLVAVGAGVVLLIIELFVMPGVLWFGALGLLLIFGCMNRLRARPCCARRCNCWLRRVERSCCRSPSRATCPRLRCCVKPF
jgi:membrane-bound serine protease (ClpP class)